MPFLDVSDILSDPLFADDFTVLRSTVSVANTGRASSNTVTFNASGVVTQGVSIAVARFPESSRTEGAIFIVTTFGLQSGSATLNADVVVWNGETYTVRGIDDYSRYGAGFVQATCEKMPLA